MGEPIQGPAASALWWGQWILAPPNSQHLAKGQQHMEMGFVNSWGQLYKELSCTRQSEGWPQPDIGGEWDSLPKVPDTLSWWEGKKTYKRWTIKVTRKHGQADKERLEEENMPLNDSTCGHLQLNILQILQVQPGNQGGIYRNKP